MPLYARTLYLMWRDTDYSLHRIPRSSYYDKNYLQTAALIRARQPFLIRNIIGGTTLFAFAISVCKYLALQFCSSIKLANHLNYQMPSQFAL